MLNKLHCLFGNQNPIEPNCVDFPTVFCALSTRGLIVLYLYTESKHKM